MNHATLTSRINIATAMTRAQRTETARLFDKSRDLRYAASQEQDATRRKRIHYKADQCWTAAMDIRGDSANGTEDRRVMHLAAALLNGKTYWSTEPTRTATVNKVTSDMFASDIAPYIAPYLSKDQQGLAEHIVSMWLKDGNVRLHYIREKGLVSLLTIGRKQAEINAIKVKIKVADQQHTQARRQAQQVRGTLQRAEKMIKDCEQEYDALEGRLAALRIDLEDALDAGDQGAINGISDIF